MPAAEKREGRDAGRRVRTYNPGPTGRDEARATRAAQPADMSQPIATLYFDFVDPLSYLVERALAGLGPAVEAQVARVGFELRPPPTPLTMIDDPTLAARWALARASADALDPPLAPPRLVPWSRKAHELHLHAATRGLAAALRIAVFEAYMRGGRDIGRVDVLVDIAEGVGLQRTESKAVLDVDRHQADVTNAEALAAAAGVVDAPTLVAGGRRLEGFHNRATLGTFLRES